MSNDLLSHLQAFMPTVEGTIQALLANSVVIGVVGWLAKVWADRNVEALKGVQTKQIEELKGFQAQTLEQIKGLQSAQLELLKGDVANLGRKFQASMEQRMLVFKTYFDMEFKAYQEIWSKCDEAADLAAMTLQYVQRVPTDDVVKEEERIDSIRRYDVCREILNEIRKKRPFITRKISDQSKDVLERCVNITDLYRQTYRYMTDDASFDRKQLIREIAGDVDAMGQQYADLGDVIADRIAQLYVMND